ncbi:hypothetical protein RHSIM_Rhsim07G0098200 [Rhododendron simsii]|uniref:VTT domain-containing protein n=1 Tax=Rhododendron simsii TaxID=118357 RepID=A0A834GU66_RHOSS|nr:hypothetical protein RHSIM_Rhsim07G0098200 [Rhododendron simsii]
MTYVVNDEEKDCVVPLLKPRDDNGDDCVKLGVSDDCGEAGGDQQAASPVFVSSVPAEWSPVSLSSLAIKISSFVTIIPIINWERKTFSTPLLAVLIFASVALFPSLLLPSSPSMWLAGMTFGYGFGFLLIIGGVVIGVSLPYFIGSRFYDKIHGWLAKYPKKASMIRLAGEGNWLDQCRDVTLIRISPFPYIIYNYCAVATNVKYGPYLLGSLIGMVPEIFVAIYTGLLIRALADASHERRSLSAPQIICNVLGFCLTVATTITVTIYAKRRLKQLHKEEEVLLR